MKIIFRAVFLFCIFSIAAIELMVPVERVIALTALQISELHDAIIRCNYDLRLNSADSSYCIGRRYKLAHKGLEVLARDYGADNLGSCTFENKSELVPSICFGKRFYRRDEKITKVWMSWGSIWNGYVSLPNEETAKHADKKAKRK